MVYWILYQAGVGGHGFTNLLEWADNITPVDNVNEWRIHYRPERFNILDRPIKFYPGDRGLEAELHENYFKANSKTYHTVLSRHPAGTLIEQLAEQEYSVPIHLYSSNPDRVLYDFTTKGQYFNLGKPADEWHWWFEKTTNNYLAMPEFKCHIDIEQAWRDWEYLNACLTQLGIQLDKKYYDQYLKYIDL